MIGSLTLSPTFKPEVTSYTGDTTNPTDKITAVPMRSGASIKITVGDAPVENGKDATWQEGANTVKVSVTYGTTNKEYTVTVNKSGAAAAADEPEQIENTETQTQPEKAATKNVRQRTSSKALKNKTQPSAEQ